MNKFPVLVHPPPQPYFHQPPPHSPGPSLLGRRPSLSVARLFFHRGSGSAIHPPRMPINWGFHGTDSVQEVFGIVRGVSDLPLGISK